MRSRSSGSFHVTQAWSCGISLWHLASPLLPCATVAATSQNRSDISNNCGSAGSACFGGGAATSSFGADLAR